MVVVVPRLGGTVVVEVAVGAVVLVVVVVELPEVVDVVLVAGTVDVVVVDVAGGDGETTLPKLVPLSPPPKMAASGLPAISSTAVMNKSAITKTTTAVPAMTRQVKRDGPFAPVPGRPRAEGGAGVVLDRRPWVAGVPDVVETSRRRVSSTGAVVEAVPSVGSRADSTASVGAEDASESEAFPPMTAVDPRRRSSGEASGARTTCLTAS